MLNFFANRKKIICSNPSCKRVFSEEELQTGLSFTNMRCPDCHHIVNIIDNASKEIEELIFKYQNKPKMPEVEYDILHELLLQGVNSIYARDIAEETDYSSILIAYRCKKLDEDYGFVIRDMSSSPYKYSISPEGIDFLSEV